MQSAMYATRRRERDAVESLLERTVMATGAPQGVAQVASGAWIGVCERAAKATGERPLISYADSRGRGQRRCLPVLHGVTVRDCSEVLLIQPANRDEPVVVGVLSGENAQQTARAHDERIVLEVGHSVQIVDRSGSPLVEVMADEQGAKLRWLQNDVHCEVAGKFALEADAIELRTTRGTMELEAAESDIVARGRYIRLN